MSIDAIKVSPKNSKKRTIILLSLVIFATVLTVYLLSATKDPVRSTSVKEKQWDVASYQVTKSHYAPHYNTFGQVSSPTKSVLSSNVSGRILEVHYLAGEAVTLDKTLISIDALETQRLFDQRQAELTEAKSNLSSELTHQKFENTTLKLQQELLSLSEKSVSRIKQLQKKSLSADSDLETALMAKTQQALQVNQTELSIANQENKTASLRARVTKANAAFEQAKSDLEETQVKAPFDSRITQVHVSKGDRVNKGSPLVSLYSLDQLELKVDLPESTAMNIRQQLVQDPDALKQIYTKVTIGNQRYQLPLQRLGGEIPSGNGGLEAIFRFPSAHKATLGLALTLGKTLACDVILPAQENTFVVPASSIYQSKYIYKIMDEKLISIPIERLGFWTPDLTSSEKQTSKNTSYVIIRAKLNDGDQVLSSLLPNAIDGLKVKIHPN